MFHFEKINYTKKLHSMLNQVSFDIFHTVKHITNYYLMFKSNSILEG